jgi:adenylate kinase
LSNLIIVVGISGVGKTTACKSFVRRNPSFGYISASEVLQQASGLSIEKLRRLSRQQILQNQILLAETLSAEISKGGGEFILLDAQNIVDNGVYLVEVPVSVLETLGPRGIILLQADPADV